METLFHQQELEKVKKTVNEMSNDRERYYAVKRWVNICLILGMILFFIATGIQPTEGWELVLYASAILIGASMSAHVTNLYWIEYFDDGV